MNTAGRLQTCASPCTLPRQRYAAQLAADPVRLEQLVRLESEAMARPLRAEQIRDGGRF